VCGIVGVVGETSSAVVEQMNASIVHRGPDDSGIFHNGTVGLAMRRLSINDQAGGHQPMLSADSRYALVYNGEIYNAEPLRRELLKQGATFQTDHSDTEVLLELLVREGENALQRLNGMFAFALFDRLEQTLFCGRDRFGIKPFYYSHEGRRFAFASELKALLVLPWVRREPDLQSLFHYLSLHYIPGKSSAFNGIDRLGPGSWLRLCVRSGELLTERWWKPAFCGSIRGSHRQLADRIAPVLSQAVDRWSIADVPIGCLLSGGLDSSAIVSMLAKQGHRLQTFTVGFSGPGEQAWDELQLARQIAAKWGTDHHEIVLDAETLLDDLVDMILALDEPYGGGLPSWAVFKAMAGQTKVAMTGTGGDELFGNYDKYRLLEGRFRSRIPGLQRRVASAERFRDDLMGRYYASDSEKREHIVTDSFSHVGDTADVLWSHFDSGPADRSLRDRVVNTDLSTQLPDEFLLMTDRFSMAHSVEARTPFLDHELATAVYRVDASARLSAWEYKPLLRRIAADLLPPDLLKAPKRGFVIPLKLWLRGRLKPLLDRLFAPARLLEQGLIRANFYEHYAVPHLAGVADHTHRLWNMLMFQLWWDIYIVRRPLDELRAEIRGRA
jgi:asparagine synthase (glutamine-hydrolysing)